MTTPRRRWFRFASSLRTLFVVMAITGIWLGWQAHVVRQRTAMRMRVMEGGGTVSSICWNPLYYGPHTEFVNRPRVSLLRSVMGDLPVAELEVPSNFTDEEMASMWGMFPEMLRLHRKEPTAGAPPEDSPP